MSESSQPEKWIYQFIIDGVEANAKAVHSVDTRLVRCEETINSIKEKFTRWEVKADQTGARIWQLLAMFLTGGVGSFILSRLFH